MDNFVEKHSADTISTIIKVGLLGLVILVIHLFTQCSSDKKISQVKNMKIDLPHYMAQDTIAVKDFFAKTCTEVKWEEYETEALLHAVEVRGMLKGGESFKVQFLEDRNGDTPYLWWYREIDGTRCSTYDFVDYLLRYWE